MNTPLYISKLHELFQQSQSGNTDKKKEFNKACRLIGLFNETAEKRADYKKSKVKISELVYYSEILEKSSFTYFEAAVLNHHITLLAYKELKKTNPDLLKLGKLMNEHHDILKNKLSITVPKIDYMIETARKHGAYGTKIIGSGGGGSILILSEKLHHKKIINELSKIGVNEIIKANESSGILSL